MPDPARGVFETLLARDGRVQALGAHLQRLSDSTIALYGREPSPSLAQQIRGRAAQLGPGEHRLRVDACPVDGSLSLTFTTAALAQRPTSFGLAPLVLTEGYGAHKLADRGPLTSSAAGGPVALLVDRPGLDGRLLEAAWANVWLLRGRQLATPPLDGRILPGVTRARLFAVAGSLGLEAVPRPITLREARAGLLVLSSSLQLAAPATLAHEPVPDPDPDAAAAVARIRETLLATDWDY